MDVSRRSFLAGSVAVAAPTEQAGQPALKVGVVNVRSCFEKDKYTRMAEALEDLGKLRDELDAQGKALQAKLAGLNEQIQAASPKGDLYVDKVRLRAHAEYDLKLLQEVARRKIRDRVADLETRIYSDLRRVVAQVARTQNLDLVLRVDESRLLEEDAEGSAAQRIAREVLFHRDALDVTAQVVAALNADWAKAWVCAACKRKVADEKCPDCGAKRP